MFYNGYTGMAFDVNNFKIFTSSKWEVRGKKTIRRNPTTIVCETFSNKHLHTGNVKFLKKITLVE